MNSPKTVSRRQWIGAAGAAASASRVLGANDKIRAGVIGTGNRGRFLMTCASPLADVSLVAVCDLYKGALKKAQELAAPGADAAGEYRRILDRKDIDAVIIATHNHWHHRIAVDALSAGKDIYLEKPMTHKLEESREVVDAAQRYNRVVQIGTHRRSSPVHQKARQMVAASALGKVVFSRVFWSRNSVKPQWRYPIPADSSPETIDWPTFIKPSTPRAFDAARFFQWFCYWDYCQGIAADLLVHSLDAAQMILNLGAPERVVADGDILFWKDGRECPDTMSAIFHFPEDVEVNFSCTFSNGQPGTREQFFGKDGTIDIVNEHQLFFYPERVGPGAPKIQEMSVSNEALTDRTAPQLHVQNFFECVRSRKPTNCPVETGATSALCAHLSTIALREQRMVRWDGKGPASGGPKTGGG